MFLHITLAHIYEKISYKLTKIFANFNMPEKKKLTKKLENAKITKNQN